MSGSGGPPGKALAAFPPIRAASTYEVPSGRNSRTRRSMSAIGPTISVSTRPAPDGVVIASGLTVRPASGTVTSAPAVPKVRFPSSAVTTSSRLSRGDGTFTHIG